MAKEKLSFTIESDAAAMLADTAEALGMPASGVVERAIRHFCIDYAPHRLELSVADNGGVGVSVERQGRSFYTRRPVQRGASHGVQGLVTVSRNGPLTRDGVLRAIDGGRAWKPAEVRSGVTLAYDHDGAAVCVNHLPLAADGKPDYVRALLRRAGEAVNDAHALSLRDVATRRCPQCGASVIEVREWTPPAGPSETEWVCVIGHHVQVP
ncbi:MAG: hypothetical protein ACOZNI_10520 [Myxococcota bacterium]